MSFISKIIEKVVLLQLSHHLSVKNLFNRDQSAYRPGHSTETALNRVMNHLLLSLDSGNISILTLLDLSAAFDTIDHNILLSRLEHVFGISGTPLSWFRSYLLERQQTVVIQTHRSNPAVNSYGVPQGSVLGPILFILYTTPLSNVISSHDVLSQSFADDTQLQKSCKPSEVTSLTFSIQECVKDVKSWMTYNKLKLNDEKTEVLIVASPRASLSNPLPDSLVVGSSTVSVCSSARNLGVIIDSNLSMKNQVSSIISSANFELRKISSIRHFLTVDATKTLVCAFILSRLDYCNSLLVNCPQDLINRLQKVQNNAARLVLRVPRSTHITPLLRSLHWLPIHARIIYKVACMTYRAINSTGPSYLSELISIYTPARSLRSSSDILSLCRPRTNTKTFGERSFSFAAPSIWNNLPLSIRSSKSDSAFRSSLKTYLYKKHLSDEQ